MPRAARRKSEESMYHVMSRSISEIDLFQCDEDKQYYISLLKKYKEKYHCRIYAYILMDNHTHIYINPCGYDISLFMRCLNNAYVAYFNRKYKRHGHLYQGRFASSIVDNDTYSLTLSAYIHNNARDMPGYAGKEEQYKYSSYGIYTGYRKDIDELVDTEFILNHFGKDIKSARMKYRAFVESMKETGIMKEVDDSITRAYTENEYASKKSYIARKRVPEEIIYKMSDLLRERLHEGLRRKYSRETAENRAFVTYIMRILCGYTYQEMCKYIGNMSISGISRLTNQGFKLLKENIRYRDAFNSLIQSI
jgi:REP element-mobilizing transposase RayT